MGNIAASKSRLAFPTKGSLTVIWLAIGLGTSGLSAILFLSFAGKSLGPGPSFTALSLVWTLLNAVGAGLYNPIEQETSRSVAARTSRGQAILPALRGPAQYAAISLGILALVALAAMGPIADTFFNADRGLVIVLIVALATMAGSYLVKGMLAGSGRLPRFGALLAVDGTFRMAAAGLFLLMGNDSALHFGLVLAISPLLSTALTIPWKTTGRLSTSQDDPGPKPPRARGMTALVLGSVLSQILSQGGAIAIALLAQPEEDAVAGNFVSASMVVRIPLFVFALVQALLLPSLAKHVALGAALKFRRTFALTLAISTVIAVGSVAIIYFFGQQILKIMFSELFSLSLTALTLVAVSAAVYVMAHVVAQGLLAHRKDTIVYLSWGTGVAAFLLALLIPGDLATRVALALTLGAAVTLAINAVMLHVVLRRWSDNGGAPETVAAS